MFGHRGSHDDLRKMEKIGKNSILVNGRHVGRGGSDKIHQRVGLGYGLYDGIGTIGARCAWLPKKVEMSVSK